ncbi:hypothetical protein JCM10213_000934 [Rhodosporidiobolus nylandii]
MQLGAHEQILTHLPLPSLLSLTLVSRSLSGYVLSAACEALWLAKVEELALPELEAPLSVREIAWLIAAEGRVGWCRTCGKYNARKVDCFLRVRLIVYEGPDEPDPAFEDFFAGTKRYAPRSRTGKSWKRHKAFFLHPTLVSTSAFLSCLLAPQLAAFDLAAETDPLAELDDYLAFSALPPATQDALEARAEWVRRVWRDGLKLAEWKKQKKLREKEERKAIKEERREREAEGERVALAGDTPEGDG